MLRACNRCHNAFEATRGQRLCPDCRAAAMHAPKIGKRVCKTCETVFDGGSRAFFCPECRIERKREKDKRNYAARKAGKTRKIGSIDLCEKCGGQYIVNGGRQRYCPQCAPEAIKEKLAPIIKAYRKKYQELHPDYKKKLSENGTICIICGKLFTGAGKVNTCSPECKEEAARRRWTRANAKRAAAKHGQPPPPRTPVRPQSGVRGVHFGTSGKWEVSLNGRYLGRFDTIEEAAACRKAAEEAAEK